MKISIIIIFCLFEISSNFILGQSYASFPGSFLRMGTTSRSVSLGGALTVDSYQGLTGVHNPASPAFVNMSYGTVGHQILSLDRKLSCIGIVTKLPPTAGLAIAWVHAGISSIEERDNYGQYRGQFSIGEDAFVLSFSQNIKDVLSLGINVKILSHSLPFYDENLRGSAVGLDFGFLYKINDVVKIGGVAQNLNAKYKWKTNVVFEESGTIYYENFPVIYRLGIRANIDKLNILFDIENITHESILLGTRYNTGFEYFLNESFALRTGLGQDRFGMGFGLNYFIFDEYSITLDYSLAYNINNYIDDIAHILSSSISF